jgi:hypothetical protein
MTRWGLILLVGYIAIGLAGLEHARAVKLAVWLTATIIVVIGVRTAT